MVLQTHGPIQCPMAPQTPGNCSQSEWCSPPVQDTPSEMNHILVVGGTGCGNFEILRRLVGSSDVTLQPAPSEEADWSLGVSADRKFHHCDLIIATSYSLTPQHIQDVVDALPPPPRVSCTQR